MLRTLITAALLTAAITQLLGLSPDIAFAYALAFTGTLWYIWPLIRLAARHRRRRRRTHRRQATPAAPAPHLTQINHHHHHYGQQPFPQPHPENTLLALPQRAEQQIAHDAIYDIINDQS